MSPDGRVEQLLELILSSGQTPHQVCADSPELLAEVQERWHHITHVEAALQALFPRSDEAPSSIPVRSRFGAVSPVEIPGYDIAEVLGTGGMGIVYRGIHRKLDRVVAIKMLLADRVATRPGNALLSREAQAIAALRHPNIVQVYDVGEVDGCTYFTMEYMEGGTLADELDGVPTSAAYAVEAMVKIARAVEAAHRAGIVHRDLKPANVLLTADGTPKVSDFGIALRAEQQGASVAAKRDGRIGTPSYMAPEQADDDRGAIGQLADVYALGAILYEMLTGRPPFRAESASETERQLLTEDPVPPSRLNARVPRDLETICLKCLQKDPSRRYETAVALADDIERFGRKEPIAARPVSVVERGVKWAQRNRATTAALVATVLLFASLFAAVLWRVSSTTAMNRAADMDLREAVRFLQQSDWTAANRAIDRAALRLADGGSSDLRARLDQARRDSALAARLDAIRYADPGTVTFDTVTFDKSEYANAFRDAGLAAPDEDAQRVARRIRESDIRPALLLALGDWAFFSRQGKGNAWLRDVIRLSDPDRNGWRDRALDPEIRDDPVRCAALLADAPINRESLPLLVGLGRQLMGTHIDPVPFLKKVQEAFPDDFWANEILASALYDASRPAEAVAYERAAIAVRPNVAWVHHNLGGALYAMGDTPGAAAQYQREIELSPNDHVGHMFLAAMLIELQRCPEALTAIDNAIRLSPAIAQCHVYRGDACRLLQRNDEAISSYRQALAIDANDKLAQAGVRLVFMQQDRTDEAIALWRTAMEQYPSDHETWDGFAEYRLFAGRSEDYGRARTELLARFGDSTDPGVCERTARACLLLAPESGEQLHRATAMIDRALAATPGDSAARRYYLVTKGLAEYRAGHFEAVISILAGDASGVLQPAPQLITAMARFRLGQLEEARSELKQAIEPFDWRPQRMHKSDAREVFIYHILRREAEPMIFAPR